MLTKVGWALILVSVAGCGTSVSVTPLEYGTGRRTPKRPSQVEIFATAPPRQAYVEVALLQADQSNGLNEQGAELMLQRMREAAGELGCDAIVLAGRAERAPAPYMEGPLPPLDYGSHLLYGTCIAYVPSAPTPVAALKR